MNQSASIVDYCRRCEAEIVGRRAVEMMISGEWITYVPTEKMRWRSYTSGKSFALGSFGKESVEFGRYAGNECGKPFVRCKCAEFGKFDGIRDVIRKEYRDAIVEKFGDKFTVPFLLSLPDGVVAWENSGLVNIDPITGFVTEVESKKRLVDAVRDLSAAGKFRKGTLKLSREDVLEGYTYLYTVKPLYRPYVAADFGPKVMVAELFQKVPVDWFDWDAMWLLYCDGAHDGGLRIGRQRGVPVVRVLKSLFQGTMKGDYYSPLAADSYACDNSVCIQVLPGTRAYPVDDTVPHVELSAGVSFLPSGRVALRGDRLAVSVEPGVSIRLASGTHVSGRSGITIFLNGTVELELLISDLSPILEGANFTAKREFRVAVVSESYDTDDPKIEHQEVAAGLRSWYRHAFGMYQATTRFLVSEAEMVLLGGKGTTGVDEFDVQDIASLDWNVEAGGAVQTAQCVVSNANVTNLSATASVVMTPFLGTAPFPVVINHAVRLNHRSAVGVIGRLAIAYDDSAESSDLEYCTDFISVQISRTTDDFMVDAGYSSASGDSLYTMTLMGAGRSQDWSLCRQLSEIGEQELLQSFMMRIYKDPLGALRQIGLHPTMHELLDIPAHMISIAGLRETGVLLTDTGGVQVVGRLQATLSWKQVARIVSSWFRFPSKSSFAFMLLREFGDHSGLRLCASDTVL